MPEDQELVEEIMGGSQAAMEVLTRNIISPSTPLSIKILVLKEGRLLHKETPEKLLAGIGDKVWSVLADEMDIEHRKCSQNAIPVYVQCT
jgi:hypothetical protein